MKKNLTWKIEKITDDQWVARSDTGVVVYADSSEKLHEWFSGRQAAVYAARSTAENGRQDCGKRSDRNRKAERRPNKGLKKGKKIY